MRAVILAAGIGSRLQPMTNYKPKCLVKVQGQTLLERQLKAFKDAGVKEVYIVTGYRADQIEQLNLKRKFKEMDIFLVENECYETTNNMYSLYLLKDFLYNKDFILCNGDIVYDYELFQNFVKNQNQDLIAVDQGRYLEESMKIKVNDDNLVIDISKTLAPEEMYGCSIDMYKFSSHSSLKLFDEIEHIILNEKKLKDWTEVAIQRLLNIGKILMKPFDIDNGRWVEIDNSVDLGIADKLFSNLEARFNELLLFIDLDGTLIKGDQIIEGADRFVNYLNERDIPYFLLSNNSSYSKLQLVSKLNDMGIYVDRDRILLSTDGVIDYLKGEKVDQTFVVGTEDMKYYMNEHGIITNSDRPEYVVLGYDTEINYQKIKQVSKFLNLGVPMLATHCDMSCPTIDGPVPDIGAFLAMFNQALGISPYKVFGKPNPEMISYKLGKILKGEPNRVPIVIGDRLYTDMEMAMRVKAKFVCVLSGETTRGEVDELERFPDLIINSVNDFVPLIQ